MESPRAPASLAAAPREAVERRVGGLNPPPPPLSLPPPRNPAPSSAADWLAAMRSISRSDSSDPPTDRVSEKSLGNTAVCMR